jgi:hypothetical protein
LSGDEDPNTLRIRGSIADELLAAGDYQHGLTEAEAILEIQLREHGPEHPFVLTSRHRVAKARYQHEGRDLQPAAGR